MISTFVNCEFCNFQFYSGDGTDQSLQIEKYEHLINHSEFFDKIKNNLKEFPNIAKYVRSKTKGALNNKRNTHQFFGIIYNYQNQQYLSKLSRLNYWLGEYGNLFAHKHKGIINRKLSADFFSFFSELELFNTLKKLNLNVEILDGSNELGVDFVVPDLNISFEVKTPLEIKNNLGIFISSKETQKQIINRKKAHEKEILVLVIDSQYAYHEFPIRLGDWVERKLINSYSNIFWDCCITFNSFHRKSDIQIIPNANLSKQLTFILNKVKSNIIS